MATTPSPAPSATEARLLAERAYHELRDRIVTLRLAPGTVLREDVLMRELAIGRTPLREAVKRLALENLVAVQPRRGTFVSAVDAADIIHITEVRADLEGFAAEQAAGRMTDGSRQAAHALLDELADIERVRDQDALMRVDERVHRLVWEAAANPYLLATLEQYFTLSQRVWYLVLDRVPGLGHAVHDQIQLLEALLEGDAPRARSTIREHVLVFQREILAALSQD
jgi:DNA-binding GntR family transcriptional regulator